MLRTLNHWQLNGWKLLRTDGYSAKQCLKFFNSSTQNILISSLLSSKEAMRFNLLPLNLTHWKTSYHKTSIISAVSITKRKWSVRSPLYFSKFQATCSANKWKTYNSEMFCPRHYHKSMKSHQAKLKKLPSSNYSALTTHHRISLDLFLLLWDVLLKCPHFQKYSHFWSLISTAAIAKAMGHVFSPQKIRIQAELPKIRPNKRNLPSKEELGFSTA